jgi:hydrogenase maturation protease HycI
LISTWLEDLKGLPGNRAEPGETVRLAVVGVGNELRADDAAGLLVVREIREHAAWAGDAALLALEAGPAPENLTGALRRFSPDVVLFVDAADLGEAPGSVRFVDPDRIDGLSAATHGLPLSIFAEYLSMELRCRVAVLGIQPMTLTMGAPMSMPVLEAVHILADQLRQLSIPEGP